MNEKQELAQALRNLHQLGMLHPDEEDRYRAALHDEIPPGPAAVFKRWRDARA